MSEPKIWKAYFDKGIIREMNDTLGLTEKTLSRQKVTEVVELSAYDQLKQELQDCREANANCISLTVHEARIAVVEAERDAAQALLKEAKEVIVTARKTDQWCDGHEECGCYLCAFLKRLEGEKV